MRAINIRFDDATIIKADAMVDAGLYASRSSMFRAAVTSLIVKDEVMVKPLRDLIKLVEDFDNWYSGITTGSMPDDDSVRSVIATIDNIKADFADRSILLGNIAKIEAKSLTLPIARNWLGGPNVQDIVYHKEDLAASLTDLASSNVHSPILSQFLRILEQ